MSASNRIHPVDRAPDRGFSIAGGDNYVDPGFVRDCDVARCRVSRRNLPLTRVRSPAKRRLPYRLLSLGPTGALPRRGRYERPAVARLLTREPHQGHCCSLHAPCSLRTTTTARLGCEM